ncbi:MAG: HU family DNA-binding protein [Bacilli bacterium]|jgi:DNA-binding protein HU-beta|nr:HU family DNA-binding protein [Erysipelotrichia bacterium]
MNKADLILALMEDTGMTKKEATDFVDAFLQIIENSLANGVSVKISGFGVFEHKKREARLGTNPATGEKIQIPASNTVTFKLSKNLKDKLN